MKVNVRKMLISVFAGVLIICLATAAVQAVSSLPESIRSEVAHGNCGAQGDNITWTLYSDGELVICGSGEMKDYSSVMPAPWSNYAENIYSAKISEGVTQIGEYAFAGTWLMRKVSLPGTLVAVGTRAFDNGGLAELELPEKLETIGKEAFSSCEITNVEIPSSVRTIGDGAFFYCDLESIVIPQSVEYVGDNAFAGCFSLVSAEYDATSTQMGNDVFADCLSLSVNVG